MATRTATASPISRPPRNVRIIFSLTRTLGNGQAKRKPAPLQLGLLPDDDLGANRHAVIEIGDVGVDQTEAAGGDGGADRVRTIGAVDAIDGCAEIHRARAERIAWAARHEA